MVLFQSFNSLDLNLFASEVVAGRHVFTVSLCGGQ